jgi:hypothetical protein
MAKAATPATYLSQGEQRALASFLAGRLPAGQLHGELCRAREAAIAKAAGHAEPARPARVTTGAPAGAPAPALHAA